jgi:amidohydrolase
VSSGDLRRDADRLAGDLVAWRRDLHRHPELGFEEHRTAEFVASRLKELGLEVETGVAHTGVVGVIRAKSPKLPPVLLRADLDALPIQEIGGREYGSTVPGRMHACGHDGHTTMLLGAANLLVSRVDDLDRDVVLCFQPGEEGMGGARVMIEEGVLDRTGARSAFALHLWSRYPAGTAHLRPGPVLAAQDEFTAKFLGSGGHGATPHQAVDPIVAAAHAVTALQTIVSRTVDPLEAAVVTVGKIEGGTAVNIIPDDASISGTLRAFKEEVREIVRVRLREVCESTAAAHRCRAEFELRPGYPATVNDPGSVDRAREVAAGVFGADNVVASPPMAASEDFAYFLQQVPGAFIILGAGNEERGITAPHHSPEFDFDEAVLPRGAELLARLALEP